MLMTTIVDARGHACPQPVIMTRNALQHNPAVTTIVDNETAQYNVTRMAEKQGYSVQAEPRADGIYLHIAGQQEAPVEQAANTPASGPLVLTVPSQFMGRGDEELGAILVRSFFHALGQSQPLPQTVVFFNSGVKLVIEGSPVLEDLRSLCDRGVQMLACGTCLDYHGMKDKIAVGEVSNMYTIVETLLQAGKVISL